MSQDITQSVTALKHQTTKLRNYTYLLEFLNNHHHSELYRGINEANCKGEIHLHSSVMVSQITEK